MQREGTTNMTISRCLQGAAEIGTKPVMPEKYRQTIIAEINYVLRQPDILIIH